MVATVVVVVVVGYGWPVALSFSGGFLYIILIGCLSILLFKGLSLFGFLIFLVQKCTYTLRDKTKGQSGKNATLTPTKILSKK